MAPKIGSKRKPFTKEHKENMSKARREYWLKIPVSVRSVMMSELAMKKKTVV
jgi:hypothetical protein